MPRPKPKKSADYRVLAICRADTDDSHLIQIGVGFVSSTRDGNRPYIAVVLNSLPIPVGSWDGRLQLHLEDTDNV